MYGLYKFRVNFKSKRLRIAKIEYLNISLKGIILSEFNNFNKKNETRRRKKGNA